MDVAPPSLDDAFKPLAGLRVIELASVLAGPLAGSFMAELGAEVIKVENARTGGDVTRQWRSAGETDAGPGAYYAAANAPKEVRLMDLSDPIGRAGLEALLPSADMVLQNFRSSGLERLGLDPAALARRHPHLIHVHLKGFMDDPDRAGYDMVVQAETGFMHMNGEPGRSPFRMPVAMMDVLAAHQMRSAALLALWQREKDGRGSYIEVWLDASGFSGLVNRGTEYLVGGHDPQASGPLHPQIAPYGETFTCACGGRVVLAVGNDRQFGALCAVLDAPEWSTDPRFARNPERVVNRSALAGLLETGIARIPLAQLLSSALEEGIPMGHVKSVGEALAGGTGKAMTTENELEGHPVRRIRQVAFKVHRNGSLTT